MAAASVYWLVLAYGFGLVRSYDFMDWQMNIGDSHVMESPGYPDPVEDETIFVWTIRTEPKAALVINCDDFRLPEEPCHENGLMVDEGSVRKNTCGRLRSYEYTSKTNALYVSLTVRNGGNHYLRCKVTSVNRKQLPGYSGTDTESDEYPFSYLDWSSEEVDSSEFGGPPGYAATTCVCGFSNKKKYKIFNGKETNVNEFPFMVGIVQTKWPTGVFCGASIITPFHALTAAHCVNNQTTGISIVVGEHDLQSENETSATAVINVRQVITHPDYSGNPKYLHDIAVMVLERQLAFNSFVAPVCMPTGPLTLTKQYATVMGWGGTEAESGYESMLKYIHVRVLSKSACHQVRRPWVPEGSPNQLCVYAKRKSACHGDSGGPVVWLDPSTNRYTIVGVNSYGAKGCATQTPIVITDVSTYLGWIQRVITETNPLGVTCKKKN